jgi:hypothetical protein
MSPARQAATTSWVNRALSAACGVLRILQAARASVMPSNLGIGDHLLFLDAHAVDA